MTTEPSGGEVVTIAALGGRGDGVALSGGARIYVPRTVPGDRVRLGPVVKRAGALHAEPVAVVVPGAARVAAPCGHFAVCGGCGLQHVNADAYRRFKFDLVRDAFARRGFDDVAIDSLHEADPGARRRVRFGVRRDGGRVRVGFHERASHRLVDLDECPILSPDIFGLIAPLRAGLGAVLSNRERMSVRINQVDTGFDLVIDACRKPRLADREALGEFANRQDLAAVSWRTDNRIEPIAIRRPAQARFGDTLVDTPPAAFLQATLDGERAIQAAVLDAVQGAARRLDLYAGCGTLTFAMATLGPVQAVELDPELCDAMRAAARRNGISHQVTVVERDLNHAPMTADDLAPFDAAVFDPPRAGAPRQAAALAESAVPTVVAVSCNPATLARDARVLVDGGYRLERVKPIDQFLWSSRVELVAVFRRSMPAPTP